MNLSDRLAQFEDEFILCRTRRHRYDDIGDDGKRLRKWQNTASVRRVTSRCERCGTKRYEAWNRITGAILASAYTYPHGYSAEKGLAPRNFRKEYLTRRAGNAKFGKL